jgi:hypothetical protein
MTISKDTLITTTDVWLSLSDASAVVHDPEFWRARATADVLVPALEALVVRGELIQWQVVENGTYQARLEWFVSEEWQYANVTSAVEYVPTAGPEGILLLRRAR